MSATGRGSERREADYYPTPAWCVQRLLDHVDLPGGDWLEPSAGEGHIVRAVNAQRDDVRWVMAEIREECGPALRGLGGLALDPADFLGPKLEGVRGFAVALGNPPFSLAQEFIERALQMAEQVIFLLRLSFLESQKREGFFVRVGVPDVYVLPERPSFTGEGTDSCAYAWMRWRRGSRSPRGLVGILYDKRQLSLLGGQP
jgi:hypothetical protein